jgi:hypothetical protein
LPKKDFKDAQDISQHFLISGYHMGKNTLDQPRDIQDITCFTILVYPTEQQQERIEKDDYKRT